MSVAPFLEGEESDHWSYRKKDTFYFIVLAPVQRLSHIFFYLTGDMEVSLGNLKPKEGVDAPFRLVIWRRALKENLRTVFHQL